MVRVWARTTQVPCRRTSRRIVRAVDRSPSSVVTLVNPDLTIAWVSQSARWVTGSDPDSRRGDSAVARIHPDDAHRLAEGLAQLRAARGHHDYLTTVPEPIRYRFQRFDGTWVVMEATIHNLLGDPEADGLLVFARPVSGHHDGVGHVIDLLVAGRPLPEVLGACAGLVPEPFGAAAVVALFPMACRRRARGRWPLSYRRPPVAAAPRGAAHRWLRASRPTCCRGPGPRVPIGLGAAHCDQVGRRHRLHGRVAR